MSRRSQRVRDREESSAASAGPAPISSTNNPGSASSSPSGAPPKKKKKLSRKQKGKRKAKASSSAGPSRATETPSSASVSDTEEEGRFTPVLEADRQARRLANAARNVGRQPLPLDEDEAYRLRYAADADIGSSQIEAYLRTLSLDDFTCVKTVAMGSGGRQESAGPRQRNGWVFFTSACGARAAMTKLHDFDINSVHIRLSFSASNFQHLKKVAWGSPSNEAIAAVISKAPTGSTTVYVQQLPRTWTFAEVEQVFGPAPRGQATIRHMVWLPAADNEDPSGRSKSLASWWMRFKKADYAAACILRFEAQVITNVRWTSTEPNFFNNDADPVALELAFDLAQAQPTVGSSSGTGASTAAGGASGSQ
ncbi:hypothetical protein OC842_006166 [Tilletia horrida]|uniref:Uncharacterized protein n=1 Tax=Tilletia horrida TaxID=155126 RepID=A0AAN6G6K6_9BASI|nr:hypothetical protein OC842_006166 [Tilletia horrida]